jgi:NAD(P)-dependent dehydrogenase (short-subunit alcohol dehydrogenase family)
VFPERAVAIRADVCDFAKVAALVDEAAAHFGSRINAVINNALADFSFNGDARPHADAVICENLDERFPGTVRGALNTVRSALSGIRATGSRSTAPSSRPGAAPTASPTTDNNSLIRNQVVVTQAVTPAVNRADIATMLHKFRRVITSSGRNHSSGSSRWPRPHAAAIH